MRTKMVAVLVMSWALAVPGGLVAGWFSNDDFVVEPFECSLVCPAGCEVLEVEVVQQKSYAIFKKFAALPYWKFIRVVEEDALEGFQLEGRELRLKVGAHTMSLEPFDYVERPDDEEYDVEDLRVYSTDGVELCRADFDVKLVVRTAAGELRRWRVRSLGALERKEALAQARSKRLTRHLLKALDGLDLTPLASGSGDVNLRNEASGITVEGNVDRRDFVCERLEWAFEYSPSPSSTVSCSSPRWSRIRAPSPARRRSMPSPSGTRPPGRPSPCRAAPWHCPRTTLRAGPMVRCGASIWTWSWWPNR